MTDGFFLNVEVVCRKNMNRNYYFYSPPTKLWEGVVHWSFWESYVTITHDALDLTIQELQEAWPSPSDMGPHCMEPPQPWPPFWTRDITLWGPLWPRPFLQVTSGGLDWRPGQTFSPEDPLLQVTFRGQDWRPVQNCSDNWWLQKHV